MCFTVLFTVYGSCDKLRDYFSDIEAVISAKLATWLPQHLGLWADHVEVPSTPKKLPPSASELMEIEEEVSMARFREVRAKLAQDEAAMCAFNAASEEHRRRLHVVSVLHEKAQVQIGKEFPGSKKTFCSVLTSSDIDISYITHNMSQNSFC